MPGMLSTSSYINATLDNWLMTLSGNIGVRIIGANVVYSSTLGRCDVTPVVGGISPLVTRTAEGLYTLTWELPFTNKPAVLPSVHDVTHQAHVYEVTNTGCKVMTLLYSGGAWEVEDIAFSVTAAGR